LVLLRRACVAEATFARVARPNAADPLSLQEPTKPSRSRELNTGDIQRQQLLLHDMGKFPRGGAELAPRPPQHVEFPANDRRKWPETEPRGDGSPSGQTWEKGNAGTLLD
jgi:hypothetical protein